MLHVECRSIGCLQVFTAAQWPQLSASGQVGLYLHVALVCVLPLVLITGKVSLSMYSKAQGIEAYVYDDKIEDADAGEGCSCYCHYLCGVPAAVFSFRSSWPSGHKAS